MHDRDHWSAFADFVAFEGAAGGPSPNLNLISGASDTLALESREEKIWLAACYAAVYNTPGSVLLHQQFKPQDLQTGQSLVEEWLVRHKPGVPIHSNRRRTHGSLTKLTAGLKSLSDFTLRDDFERGDDYDRLWAQVHEVNAVGRYFGIKFAGTLERLGLTDAKQYDIRARGAKNGRKTLALLFPDHATKLDLKTGKNSKEAVRLAEECASLVKDWLTNYNLHVGWFQLEALLCEYNQMLKGHRYPGSTSDGDLEVYVKVFDHFGPDCIALAPVWEAREKTLPSVLWSTRKRKDMLGIYADHNYVWSDALYKRPDTDSEQYETPVVRSTPLTDWEPLTRPDWSK